jgi:hypothetical protein
MMDAYEILEIIKVMGKTLYLADLEFEMKYFMHRDNTHRRSSGGGSEFLI